MQLDVTRPLMVLDGKAPILNENKEPVLLRDVIAGAMLSANGASSTDEKVTRYKLARLVTTIDQPEIKAEDVVLIKRLLGEVYAPLIVGQAVEMID